MTNDLDITSCRMCGAKIVINIAELDFPICNRVSCFKSAFPDDYEGLMNSGEAKHSANMGNTKVK